MTLSAVVSLAVSIALLWTYLRTGILAHIEDVPNARSLHSRPIPRIGGLALIPATAAGVALSGHAVPLFLTAPVALLFLVSLLDDVKGLRISWRFLAHISSAGVLVLGTLDSPGNLLIVAVLCVLLVWMTNLYNFMDGSDGLAGGMALIGFSAYGVAAYHAGPQWMAAIAFSIAASSLGFLLYNFNPARVFMGDAGSIPLGFLAGALGIVGWHLGTWPLWFPVLVFSAFVVDASATLAKRLLGGSRIWEAHKDHYYQRLIQLGWSHRKTALGEYGLMAASGLSALWATRQTADIQVATLLLWVAVFVVLAVRIDAAWTRRQFKEEQ